MSQLTSKLYPSILFVGVLIGPASGQTIDPLPETKVEAGDLSDVTVKWSGDTVSVISCDSGVRVIRQHSDDPKQLLIGILGRKPGTYEIAFIVSQCVEGKARTTVSKAKVTVTPLPGPSPTPPNPAPPGPGPAPPPPPLDVPPLPPAPGPSPVDPPFVPPDNFRGKLPHLSQVVGRVAASDRIRLARAHRMAAEAVTAEVQLVGEVQAIITSEVEKCGVTVSDELARAMSAEIGKVMDANPKASLDERGRQSIRGILRQIADVLAK